MKTFFRFFAQRHIRANLIILMTVLPGLGTMMGIKRDIYPRVHFGIMDITTPLDYPAGACLYAGQD